MITPSEARKLSNKAGFQKKVEVRIEEIERRIKEAAERGQTRTCVFGICSDSDKSDVDIEVKRYFKSQGFIFRRSPVNGGVIQDTEDICW